MKVKRLKMTSFRGIGDLTLELATDEPTVFLGVNGVGKSSILDCLAVFLSRLMMAIRTPSGFMPPIVGEEDITNGREETRNECTISINGLGDMPLSWNLERKIFDRITDSHPDESAGWLKVFHNFIYEQFKANPDASLPLAVYYPTDRAVEGICLDSTKEYLFVQIAAYDGAIAEGKIDFTDLFAWFKQREDLENEVRLDNNPDYRDKQLEAVRQAIAHLLGDNFSNLRVRRSPLRMTVKKQDRELIVNQLSDGEKCLLAMVGDLARRLAIANPGLSNPLKGCGVVLIDEIELHLHPAWQRKIIPALTKTFPNCQFIVTTHSPQVVSHVKPEGVYCLQMTPQGIVAMRPESSFGRDSNRILEDLMGVSDRPQEIKNSLHHLFRLIDDGKLAEAKEFQKQLEDEIGEDEPEFASAEVQIRRKEILGR